MLVSSLGLGLPLVQCLRGISRFIKCLSRWEYRCDEKNIFWSRKLQSSIKSSDCGLFGLEMARNEKDFRSRHFFFNWCYFRLPELGVKLMLFSHFSELHFLWKMFSMHSSFIVQWNRTSVYKLSLLFLFFYLGLFSNIIILILLLMLNFGITPVGGSRFLFLPFIT